MENERKKLLLKKFKSIEEMRQFIFDYAKSLQVSEMNKILKTLRKIEEGEYTFVDVIQKGTKLNGIPKVKNAELYQDVIEDLENQRAMAEFLGKTKLANRLSEEKWVVLDSAEKEDVGIYLKKYYPKGYNLLAKILKTLEKGEHTCYNDCIHKLVNEKNLTSIVRVLENLSQVNPQINSLVDSNLDVNSSLHLPTINGMPIGGYGFFGDAVKKVTGRISDFFKKKKPVPKEKIYEPKFNETKDSKVIENTQNSTANYQPKALLNKEITQNNFEKSQPKTLEKDIEPDVSSQKKNKSFLDKTKTAIGKGYDFLKGGLDSALNSVMNAMSSNPTVTYNVQSGEDIASAFSDDFKNFDINNEDFDKINDAKNFSSYKGKLVIKNDIAGIAKKIFGEDFIIGGTFAFGDFIFVDKNASVDKITNLDSPAVKKEKEEEFKKFKNTIKHEYGHTKQYENLGFKDFVFDVAIPSMNGVREGLQDEDYFIQPWERSADILGDNGEINIGSYDPTGVPPVGQWTKTLTPYTVLTNLFNLMDSWDE